MRICLYTSTALPKLGGQEAVVDSLARHLSLLGHHAVVLAPQPRRPLHARDDLLPYPVARHPRFYSTRRFISFYRRWLLNLHRRERFDVIHCHDVYPTGYLAVLGKEALGIPIVITSHGGDVKEGNIRIIKPGMRPRYVRAVEQASAIISIAEFTADGCRKLSEWHAPMVTIPNGIDLEPFATAAPRPNDLDNSIISGKYVLFLGRLKDRKGVDVLIDAIARLPASDHPQCVIAGSGEDEQMLRARAASAQVENRVRFVGRVEGATKLYLLQNALCVVMPSRVWEAFPLVLLESYAAGKPVIGSDIPGIADLIRREQTGLLVPQNSPDDLAIAIERMMRNPDEVKRMGENAKQVAQGYSWTAVTQQHIALYQRLARLAV
ncbi:MAG TPA: glycosyltransferase family 4 protein [Humisphaera sp.]|jgi:1,4-alpha-glucan branching enzyme|nr:glycosyltransferase family 4 protein [Humisphaera sp.]